MSVEPHPVSSADQLYGETTAYLFGLQRFGIKFGLENMQRMLHAFGTPHHRLRTVHIAGSNGKGSVAAFVAKIMQKAGYRVGLYTSPHLSDFTERIRIDGQAIAHEKVVQLTCAIRERQHKIAREDGTTDSPTSVVNMTFFEFTTLMALLFFAQNEVDLAVVEVGMGGRLDATNVLVPLISVITTISKEHQQYLGNTIEEISREKAGIIKPHGILVTSVTQPKVLAQFRSRCRELGSAMYTLGEEFSVKGTGPREFDYQGVVAAYQGLQVEMAGEYQLPNAALAVATAELLEKQGLRADERAVREGLRETRWPGRLEQMNANPTVVLDGAHNLEAIRKLRQELQRNWSYRRLILVIGIMEDKAIKPILKEILPLGYYAIFTRPKGERSASPAFLFRCGRRLIPHAEIVEDVKEAVRKAMVVASRNDLICVTGSLYTVAEAREVFSARVEL